MTTQTEETDTVRIAEGAAPLSRRQWLVVQYALVELARSVQAGRTNHWDPADGPPPAEAEAVDLVAHLARLRRPGAADEENEAVTFEVKTAGRHRGGRVAFIGGVDGPTIEVNGKHLGFFDLCDGPEGHPRLIVDRDGDGPPAAVITLLPGAVGVAVDPGGRDIEYVLSDHRHEGPMGTEAGLAMVAREYDRVARDPKRPNLHDTIALNVTPPYRRLLLAAPLLLAACERALGVLEAGRDGDGDTPLTAELREAITAANPPGAPCT